jgi:hypothetical protein
MLLDALRTVAVALGAAVAAFFPKKSAIDAWVVGFVFLAGFIYASLLSSSLSALFGSLRK